MLTALRTCRRAILITPSIWWLQGIDGKATPPESRLAESSGASMTVKRCVGGYPRGWTVLIRTLPPVLRRFFSIFHARSVDKDVSCRPVCAWIRHWQRAELGPLSFDNELDKLQHCAVSTMWPENARPKIFRDITSPIKDLLFYSLIL